MTDLQEQRRQFIEAGYDVIPLRPFTKDPLCKGWPSKSTLTQWRNAPADSNLGLRAGQGKIFFDCDDKNRVGTSEAVINWLVGLGYDRGLLPIVQTASGIGRHVYATTTASLFGNRKDFYETFGEGHLLFGSAAQVATFPDVIEGGGEYRLLQGDITQLPSLDIHDIQTIIDINGLTEPQPAKKKPSALARALMAGAMPDKYKGNRSAAEGALVLSLIDSNHTYEDIRRVFQKNPCAGHYRDPEKYKTDMDRDAYLYRTYQEMLAYYNNHENPKRARIAKLIELATLAAWPKVTDKIVFLEHLRIARHAAKYEYAASIRDLALGAGVGFEAARQANRRIIARGLLELIERGSALSPHVYHLDADKVSHSLRTPTREGMTLNVHFQNVSIHDAFRNGGKKKKRLGRRAGEIYELLGSEALQIPQIAERTGAHPKTVKRVLDKMQRDVRDYRTGEVIEMVSCGADDAWYSNLVDLDIVAAWYQTTGAHVRQRDQYERERREQRKHIELMTIKKGQHESEPEAN